MQLRKQEHHNLEIFAQKNFVYSFCRLKIFVFYNNLICVQLRWKYFTCWKYFVVNFRSLVTCTQIFSNKNFPNYGRTCWNILLLKQISMLTLSEFIAAYRIAYIHTYGTVLRVRFKQTLHAPEYINTLAHQKLDLEGLKNGNIHIQCWIDGS